MSKALGCNEVRQVLLPVFEAAGQHYRKNGTVMAREAIAGEKVITQTSDGRETQNVARQGAYVVRNNTGAKETYIVAGPTFQNRYEFLTRIDETWSEYSSRGEIQAIEVDRAVIALLGGGDQILIETSWGDTQPVKPGDFLAMPLPDKNEIYRIALKEFQETYSLDK